MDFALFSYDVALLCLLCLAAQCSFAMGRGRGERALLWVALFFALCGVDHVRLMAVELGVAPALPEPASLLADVLFDLAYLGLGVCTRLVAVHLFDLPLRRSEVAWLGLCAALCVVNPRGSLHPGLHGLSVRLMGLYLSLVAFSLLVGLVRRSAERDSTFLRHLILLLGVALLDSLCMILPAGPIAFPLSGVRSLSDEVLTLLYLAIGAWYVACSSGPAGSSVEGLAPAEPDLERLALSCGLSEREREVMRLIAGDLTYGSIGAELWISESTVKSHARRIYKKLGVANRAEFSELAKSRAGHPKAPGAAGESTGPLSAQVL